MQLGMRLILPGHHNHPPTGADHRIDRRIRPHHRRNLADDLRIELSIPSNQLRNQLLRSPSISQNHRQRRPEPLSELTTTQLQPELSGHDIDRPRHSLTRVDERHIQVEADSPGHHPTLSTLTGTPAPARSRQSRHRKRSIRNSDDLTG